MSAGPTIEYTWNFLIEKHDHVHDSPSCFHLSLSLLLLDPFSSLMLSLQNIKSLCYIHTCTGIKAWEKPFWWRKKSSMCVSVCVRETSKELRGRREEESFAVWIFVRKHSVCCNVFYSTAASIMYTLRWRMILSVDSRGELEKRTSVPCPSVFSDDENFCVRQVVSFVAKYIVRALRRRIMMCCIGSCRPVALLRLYTGICIHWRWALSVPRNK